MEAWKIERMNERMNERMEGRINEWKNGRLEG